jgi:glycosyltransferase involved in cell wall biosynthesis
MFPWRFPDVATVVVHAGGPAALSALRHCLPALAGEFARRGVVFCGEAQRAVAACKGAAARGGGESPRGPLPEAEAFVRAAGIAARQAPGAPRAAFTLAPWGFVHPEGFAGFRALLRGLFPRAEALLCLALPRQDLLQEMAAMWGVAHGRTENRFADHPRRFCYDYHVVYENAARVFGEKNLRVFFESGGEGDAEAALRDFLDTVLGAAGDGDPPLPEERLPSWPFLLPQSFRAFWRVCSSHASPDESTTPWIAQAGRFRSAAGVWCLPARVRGETLARYSASNALLARRLGKEALFDPPGLPDAGREPDEEFVLGAEDAVSVALRLDRDFARARMAEFDATPVHSLTREMRLCRAALHEVHDPPAAAPRASRAKQEEPRLCVCTLTYNHAPFIAENIESVLAQRVDFPIQHIIADDGSDDGTREIILDYAARHSHIVPLLRKSRDSRGWSNVHAMFDMARARYVALCEGDDYFTDPDKLQSQADFLDANPDFALCFHPVRVVYDPPYREEHIFPTEEHLPRGFQPAYALGDLILSNFIQTNSVMYRWRFRDGLPGWFRTDIFPGDWYWHLLHAEQGKIACSNRVMSVYRRHSRGLYWSSTEDPLRHAAVTGFRELAMYDVVNRHFNGQYESALLPLTDGVFAVCMRYDVERAEKDGAAPVLDTLCAAYPAYARHFMTTLRTIFPKAP